MESHQNLEFVRGQGTKLLTSLPATVRSRLRHYEVAAVMPFQPRAPLHGAGLSKRFVYAVVSDWSLLLVAMSAKEEATVMLELPLLLIEDMDIDTLDVDDFANDSRQAVRSTCISIFPQQAESSQKQLHRQQQHHAASMCQQLDQQDVFQAWQLQQQLRQLEVGQQQQQAVSQEQHQQSSCGSRHHWQIIKGILSAGRRPTVRVRRSAVCVQPAAADNTCSNRPATTEAEPAAGIARHDSLPQAQKERGQQQLARQLMQRLQMPVQASQPQQVQAQQLHISAAQPIAEAIEESPSTAGAVVLDASAPGTTTGVPPWMKKQASLHTAAAPVSVTESSCVGTSNSGSRSRMAMLKERLTVDTTVTAAAPQLQVLQDTTAGPQLFSPTAGQTQPELALTLQEWQQIPHKQECPLQQNQQQLQQRAACTEDWDTLNPSYCLRLVTVERATCLFFHIHCAWISAHVRAALASADAPGLPTWLPPPSTLFQIQSCKEQLTPNAQLQQSQQPSAHPATPSVFSNLFKGRSAHSRNASPVVSFAAGAAQLSCSVSSGSSLSTEAQAALQADMAKFFGMNRNSATARRLQGPFPGDEPIFSHQQQQRQPSPESGFGAAVSVSHVGHGMWENDPSLDGRISNAQQQRESCSRPESSPGLVPVSAFTPISPAISPAYAADCNKLMARYSCRRASCTAASSASGGKATEQQGRTGKGVSPGMSGKQHKMLRTFMQVGAGMYAQHTTSEARDLFWSLAEGLMQPASLFDDSDTSCIKQLVLELAFCKQEQVAALQQAFFNSADVMSFLLARLTSWGAVMNLFPQAMPPIQNPAQPGRLDAWRGKVVAWTSSLMYPGRPTRLLKKLGLVAGSKVCFRSALNAALSIAEKRRHAAEHAARSSSSTSNHLRNVPMSQTYHADPLNLSPLASLAHVYMFVADARRMVGGRASVSGGSEASFELHKLGETDFSEDESSGSCADCMSSTMAEATNILRWERLAGRLAARIAGRKMQLVLYWLQMQLSFTEGVASRLTWLSDKALGPSNAHATLSSHWTYKAATQQLIATLLTLNLPGTKQYNTLIPGGVDDLLWWAQNGADCWMLDYLVGVLHELMALCEQQEQLMAQPGVGLVMEVIQQAPRPQLQHLLRCLFVRFVCLMGGGASNREYTALPPGVAAVLGYKYGCVLLEILGGVVGAADGLHDTFGVEVQHILQVPEVRAQLSVAEAGAHGGVLGRSSIQLLEEVLNAVEAAVPWSRMPEADERLRVAALGLTGSVIKVQN